MHHCCTQNLPAAVTDCCSTSRAWWFVWRTRHTQRLRSVCDRSTACKKLRQGRTHDRSTLQTVVVGMKCVSFKKALYSRNTVCMIGWRQVHRFVKQLHECILDRDIIRQPSTTDHASSGPGDRLNVSIVNRQMVQQYIFNFLILAAPKL